MRDIDKYLFEVEYDRLSKIQIARHVVKQMLKVKNENPEADILFIGIGTIPPNSSRIEPFPLLGHDRDIFP